MTCQETKPLFLRYLDDDLGIEDRLAVERHTAHCYACHEELHELRTLLEASRDALTPPPPTHRFEDLVPLLHAEPPVPVPARSVWRDAARLVAAAVVILVLAATTDAVLGSVRNFVTVVERAVSEEPVPSESAQGLLGWRQRIAWAATSDEQPAEAPAQKRQDAQAKTPDTKPGNTTWVPGGRRPGHMRYAASFDRPSTKVSFIG